MILKYRLPNALHSPPLARCTFVCLDHLPVTVGVINVINSCHALLTTTCTTNINSIVIKDHAYSFQKRNIADSRQENCSQTTLERFALAVASLGLGKLALSGTLGGGGVRSVRGELSGGLNKRRGGWGRVCWVRVQ